MLKKIVLPEILFLIIGFIFGTAIMFVTPANLVPDEVAHTIRACEISEGHFYNNVPYSDNNCYKKLRDAHILPKVNIEQFQGASGYSPVNYIASGLGLKIFSVVKNPQVMYYAGRFFNFLLWLGLIFLAIHITPVFKWQFLFCSLLPMNIYEGMSYSADSLSNAFSFLFFAYMFSLIFAGSDCKKQKIGLLYILSAVGAFCKGVIYPIFLFVFAKFKNIKNRIFITFTTLIFSFILYYIWQSLNFVAIADTSAYEAHKHILLHSPITFWGIFIKTLLVNASGYIRGTIGVFGWGNIELPLIAYIVGVIIFMASFIALPTPKITKVFRGYAALILAIFIIAIHALIFCTWTPIGAEQILGMQGRYFVQILPLSFILFSCQSKSEECSKCSVVWKVVMTVYSVLLLVFTLCAIHNYVILGNG